MFTPIKLPKIQKPDADITDILLDVMADAMKVTKKDAVKILDIKGK